MKNKLFAPVILIAFLIFNSCADEGPFAPSENLKKLDVIDIQIPHEEYTALLSNKISDFETACKFSYRGKIYTGLISSSGAGSRYLDKWSYQIKITEGGLVEGLREFNLSSQIYDTTNLYTAVASRLYRQAGFPLFFSKHVFLRINGKDAGLYPLIERVEEDFFLKRGLPVYELFKVGFDAKFTFRELNNPKFFFEKKIPDDNNYNSLVEFIYALDTSSSARLKESLGRYLNIENYLYYHSLTSLLHNSDAFTNNFYLFSEEPGKPFKVIPWDFDKCFQQPANTMLAGYNQIITKLFTNAQILDDYKRITKELLRTVFTEENLFSAIDSTAAVIEDGYKLDPYLGKGRFNFTDEIIKLKNYIAARRKFFTENIDHLQGM